MKKTIVMIALVMGASLGTHAINSDELALANKNIKRAMAIVDATWEKTIKGSDTNMYMVDVYDTMTGAVSGPSDVWPYTAAIEAHCSLLEALIEIKDENPELYNNNFVYYRDNLVKLIDNLEYYRGTFRLSSYATSNKEWSPYAVPRAGNRGEANVTGILNVYDDQMWLSRELIRAYRVTDNAEYLDLATYLADYSLDGWDCWRDENGEEYGGITWGPGYNSKHACSNAPIIQPLVWLSEIYEGTEAEMVYAYRDINNSVVRETRLRSELYLEFARKVYNWQRSKLWHSTGTYLDMLGADNTILVSRGYRQHVDCGDASGYLYSYNTGTMIAGGAELYRVTGEENFKNDVTKSTNGALSAFTKYVREHETYEFKTDQTAESGFNTWFNNVLMRSFVDAYPYADNNRPETGLEAFQTTLDYAFDNHNRGNMLPIHLLDGWGSEVKTKGFHQFAFASEYAMLAVWLLTKDDGTTAIDYITNDDEGHNGDMVMTMTGIALGSLSEIESSLPRGLYIVGGKKMLLGN